MNIKDIIKIKDIHLPEREVRASELIREVHALNAKLGGVSVKEALIRGIRDIGVAVGTDYALNHWLFLYELGTSLSESHIDSEKVAGINLIDKASLEIEMDSVNKVSLFIYVVGRNYDEILDVLTKLKDLIIKFKPEVLEIDFNLDLNNILQNYETEDGYALSFEVMFL